VPTDVGVLEMRVVPELILQDAPKKNVFIILRASSIDLWPSDQSTHKVDWESSRQFLR
jgi:hypothetical protein